MTWTLLRRPLAFVVTALSAFGVVVLSVDPAAGEAILELAARVLVAMWALASEHVLGKLLPLLDAVVR